MPSPEGREPVEFNRVDKRELAYWLAFAERLNSRIAQSEREVKGAEGSLNRISHISRSLLTVGQSAAESLLLERFGGKPENYQKLKSHLSFMSSAETYLFLLRNNRKFFHGEAFPSGPATEHQAVFPPPSTYQDLWHEAESRHTELLAEGKSPLTFYVEQVADKLNREGEIGPLGLTSEDWIDLFKNTLELEEDINRAERILSRHGKDTSIISEELKTIERVKELILGREWINDEANFVRAQGLYTELRTKVDGILERAAAGEV